MKVNTDGVLLGAWALSGGSTKRAASTSILDIGTGTGVIALMLAQRFPNAEIDAVEIDKLAATTAAVNFQASPFAARLKAYPLAIEHYFMLYPDKKFDLIVSNPPFFIDSLKSADKAKEAARHTDYSFFEELYTGIARQLSREGTCCMILPPETAAGLEEIAARLGLFVNQQLNIRSFEDSRPHRKIICLGFDQQDVETNDLAIYAAEKVYHPAYQHLLKDFLTIF